MSIKTNLIDRHAHALDGYTLLAVEGPEAEAFLQAQLMNDVRKLSPMQWQWNGWLNPKGRVIALFALVRLSPECFWLVLPDFPAGELLPRLQRFVFRSKAKLRVVDDWRAAAVFDRDASADAQTPEHVGGDAESGYRLDMGGDGGPRQLALLPCQQPSLLPADAGTDQQWLAYDIAHGMPRLDESQREAWTPQMLSLERLHAFSLKKGCYPGQEIVARTHYLGHAKRALTQIEGIGLAPGQEIQGAGAKLGTIISATLDGRHALAVLPAGMDPETVLATDAGHCRLRPLFNGLARPR